MQVESCAGVVECGCDADTLFRRGVHDDGVIHALTHDGDVVTADGGEALVAEVVYTVRNEDVATLFSLGCVVVGHFESRDEAVAIAWYYCEPVALLTVCVLSLVDNAHVVEVVSSAFAERDGVCALRRYSVLDDADSTVLASLGIECSYYIAVRRGEGDGSLGIAAEAELHVGHAAQQDLDGVGSLEYPTMVGIVPSCLCVVVQYERLVVGGAEAFLLQVEVIACCVVGSFDVCHDSIEVDVALYLVILGVLDFVLLQ